MLWIARFPFEASTPSDSGGAEIVLIPAGTLLENVMLPPAPNFGDPNAGARPVEFDYEGRTYTATTDDFLEVGACYQQAN